VLTQSEAATTLSFGRGEQRQKEKRREESGGYLENEYDAHDASAPGFVRSRSWSGSWKARQKKPKPDVEW